MFARITKTFKRRTERALILPRRLWISRSIIIVMTKYEGTKLSGFEPIDNVDELQIIDKEIGTGAEVQPGATVTAHYTGALCKNGIIFQSSHDFGDAISFPLDGVIEGWKVGVPGMRIGGWRRLIIPAAMAYGDQSPAPNIPARSDLVFDIELVAIR